MEDAYWQKTENRRKQKGRVKFTHEDGKLGLLILSSHITKKKRGGALLRLFSTFPMICADFHPTHQLLASPALMCLIYYFTFHWLLMNHTAPNFLFSHKSKKSTFSFVFSCCSICAGLQPTHELPASLALY